MTDNSEAPKKFEGVEFVKIEAAAPTIGSAEYFKHPQEGWVRVLDSIAEIEKDIVVVAYGDPETGEFISQYVTWYPDTEILIARKNNDFVEDQLQNPYSDDMSMVKPEPADDIVKSISKR